MRKTQHAKSCPQHLLQESHKIIQWFFEIKSINEWHKWAIYILICSLWFFLFQASLWYSKFSSVLFVSVFTIDSPSLPLPPFFSLFSHLLVFLYTFFSSFVLNVPSVKSFNHNFWTSIFSLHISQKKCNQSFSLINLFFISHVAWPKISFSKIIKYEAEHQNTKERFLCQGSSYYMTFFQLTLDHDVFNRHYKYWRVL